MANTILTPTQVTREALRILHEKINFIGSINRQYDSSFANAGAKIGDSLAIRLPNEFTVRTGAVIDVQQVAEQSVTMSMATQKGVDISFTSKELTLHLDDFSSRILEPAMSTLASHIEADALSMVKDVYNVANFATDLTPSSSDTTPSMAQILAAKVKLNQMLTPKDRNRTALLDSSATAGLVDALKALFQDQSSLSKQYREGVMGYASGFTFAENDLLPSQTVGDRVVDDAKYVASGSSGATFKIDDFTAATPTIKAGEIIRVAGVYAVHPETKVAYPWLKTFVVTSNVNCTSNAGTLTISPAIVTSGAGQNVSAAPVNAAAVYFCGDASATFGQQICYHKDAFAFVTADLEDVSQYGTWGARETMDGISMRIARQYQITNDTIPCRIDVLYGYKAIRPQLACRIWT